MKKLIAWFRGIKIRTWIILGVVIVVIGIVLGLRLRGQNQAQAALYQTQPAARGSLIASVGATGTVRARQTATLSWQTTGTIGTVGVQPGDPVKAGDVLAALEATSLPQNVILAQADLVTAQKNLDDLINSKTAQANAQLALANAQSDYETAQSNYAYNTTQRATSETIADAKAQLVLDQKYVDAMQRLYNNTSNLEDDNPARANAYNNLYNAWKTQDRDIALYNWYTGKPTDTELAQLTGKLALAKATLEDAQRSWDLVKNGPAQSDVDAAQARVNAELAIVAQAKLTAPFGGTVTEVDGLVGDQVAPGKSAFRIDDLSKMLVDVQVSEVDINSVRIGQKVTLTFDASQGKTYNGTVVTVAQAGDVSQGAVNFTVTVELADADAQVKPGMTAAVTVIVKQLDNVLLVPNGAVRLVNNQQVVYVLANGVVQEVPITLGATSDTVSQVLTGGLKVGDPIILNPPSTLFTRRTGGGGGGVFGGGGGG